MKIRVGILWSARTVRVLSDHILVSMHHCIHCNHYSILCCMYRSHRITDGGRGLWNLPVWPGGPVTSAQPGCRLAIYSCRGSEPHGSTNSEQWQTLPAMQARDKFKIDTPRYPLLAATIKDDQTAVYMEHLEYGISYEWYYKQLERRGVTRIKLQITVKQKIKSLICVIIRDKSLYGEFYSFIN